MTSNSKALVQIIVFPLLWILLFVVMMWSTEAPGALIYEVNPALHWPMLEVPYAYFILLAGSILFPFLLSFDKKVHFWKKWLPLLKANTIAALFFIIWDVVFTQKGVWGFNEHYFMGATWFGLPVEEWLWFFVIPYCCVFIYECLFSYMKKDPLLQVEKGITIFLTALFIIMGSWYIESIYTSITCYSAAMITLFHWKYRPASERSRIYWTWLIGLIPFFFINGALTGGFTNEPIVLYGENVFTGIRWYTIPVDDTIYLYVYLFWVVYLFEIFMKKYRKPEPNHRSYR